MPLLNFTPADIQKSKLLEDGWYGLIVKDCSEWTPSKDGKSLNITINFVVEGQNEKEIPYIINNTGLGFHVGLCAALLGVPIKQIQEDPKILTSFNTDTTPGQKIDGHVIVDNYQGRNNNKVSAFLPYGKGREQSAKSVY